MKIQQVSFNGKQVIAKSGALAYVGDGIKYLITNACAGEVNAITGHQFVIPAEVDGRDGVLVSVTTAAAGVGGDTEYPSQQTARAAHFAGGNQIADVAAGDRLAANHHDWVGFCFKAEFKPKT